MCNFYCLEIDSEFHVSTLENEGRKEIVSSLSSDKEVGEGCNQHQRASIFPGFALTWNFALKVTAGFGSPSRAASRRLSAKMHVASVLYHRQICHLSSLTGIWKPGTTPCVSKDTERASGEATLETGTDWGVGGEARALSKVEPGGKFTSSPCYQVGALFHFLSRNWEPRTNTFKKNSFWSKMQPFPF